MAYTPINWQTGDTITAEKMNKMDNGWSIESTPLFSETVTTATAQGAPAPVAALTYNSQLSDPILTITFDGVDYICSAVEWGAIYYGEVGETGPDFTNYPFVIESAVDLGGGNSVYTETAGTHTVSVQATVLQTSVDFNKAVNAAVDSPTYKATENVTTWQEIHDAMAAGKIVYLIDGGNGGNVVFAYVLTARTNSGVYEVVALYLNSSNDISIRYYNANSASSPIYPN